MAKEGEKKDCLIGFLFLIWDLNLVFLVLWDLGCIYKNIVCNKIENTNFC